MDDVAGPEGMSGVDFPQYDSQFIEDLPLNEAAIVVLRKALRAFGLMGLRKMRGRESTEAGTTEALAYLRLFHALSTDVESAQLADALNGFNDVTAKSEKLRLASLSSQVEIRSWLCLSFILRQLTAWAVKEGSRKSVDSDAHLQSAADRMYDLSGNNSFGFYLRYGRDETVIFVPPVDRFLTTPLWADEGSVPNEPNKWLLHNQPKNLALIEDLSENGLIWGFWKNWYQSMMDGRLSDQEFQSAVVKIPNDVWLSGAQAVAEEIEKIKARRALEAEIAALKEQLRQTQVVKRPYHRLHNNPPEAIESHQQLKNEITRIWELLEDAETEVGKASPSPSALRVIADTLWEISVRIGQYCAALADIALKKSAEVIGEIGTKAAIGVLVTTTAAQNEGVKAVAHAIWDFVKMLPAG
ncbi:hypothetical protein OS189_13215 [Sulfitobacter sp. F26169L]|uniref:hypothetical protein n=1 Tax=Sulfitobacter sp. F26169L TaxID=2996015 RepID=UPI0022608E2E|nr:hypothetical protein [Sulfitobacter sp. F26169L]MCX7567306.1 hypothetical protein [Sulfitobacter sp. F26169L]